MRRTATCIWSLGWWGVNSETDPLRSVFLFTEENDRQEIVPQATLNWNLEDLMMTVIIEREPNTGEGLTKTIEHSSARTRRIRCLLGTMFALVVADGLITNYLTTLGLGTEWNPFLRALVGQEHFLAIKIAGALVSTLLLWDIYRKRPQMAVVSTLCVVVLYTGIVYWNLFAFFITQI